MVALASYFLNPAGLATALVLIPFILLYLIKPKPQHERIPSLLFIMKEVGKSNVNSLFRNWMKDPLFLFQLIVFLALILAAAQPYINVPRSYLVEQNVILLDASGSMAAGNNFAKAKDLAIKNLGKENTIILIKGNPQLLEERVSSAKATEAIQRLKVSDTPTALTDALQMATSYAAPGTRVVVISDFKASTGDPDYKTAADALEGTGAIVDYLPLTSEGHNIGIIDLLVGPVQSSVWLKNYDTRPQQVTLRISDAEQQVLLAKEETKEIDFKTPPGVAEVKIEEKDALATDNTAWTSTPEKNRIKMLIITNERSTVERSNFLLALNVIEKNFPTSFDIGWAEPPKVPNLNHDVYVIDKTNLDYILPGIIKELKEKVSDGASLIVFSQNSLFTLNWEGLLPIEPVAESAGTRSSVAAEEESLLTQDLNFGQTSSYNRVAAAKGATVVAKTEADPIILLQQLGKGHILYYGLDDTKASFSKDPSYPVFWRRAFDLLTNRPSLANLNIRTGSVIALAKSSRIKTPDGTVTTQLLPIEKAGLYTLSDRTIAANMLNAMESDLSPANVSKRDSKLEAAGNEKAPKELIAYFLWIAIAFLLFELIYIKYRGDF